MTDGYRVLVRVDDAGCVTAINSDAFVADASGWVQIDSGYGDTYHHAQGNYLPGPLTEDRGVYRYKLVDGAVVERTRAEMDADYVTQEPTTTAQELLEAMMGGIEDA